MVAVLTLEPAISPTLCPAPVYGWRAEEGGRQRAPEPKRVLADLVGGPTRARSSGPSPVLPSRTILVDQRAFAHAPRAQRGPPTSLLPDRTQRPCSTVVSTGARGVLRSPISSPAEWVELPGTICGASTARGTPFWCPSCTSIMNIGTIS